METAEINFTEELTDTSFSSVINSCTEDSSFKDEIALANILVAPYDIPIDTDDKFKFANKNIFPVSTSELFRYLKQKAPEEIKLDIATKDEDYLELAQHSDLVNLPTIIVSTIVSPIVVGLITNYIYDSLKVEKTTIKSEIIVSDSNGNNKSFKYEGPADQYELTMSKIFK
ncbi:MAG: hypothetical protein RBT65_08675 [Methanolobus sp.]|nr:hypothetical protein [Methanolobus sp.]